MIDSRMTMRLSYLLLILDLDRLQENYSFNVKSRIRAYFRLLLNRSPINYHVTLVFRASRALRRPKLNPNPSL